MFEKIVKLFSSKKIVVKNIKQQSKVDITNIENVNIKSSEDFQKLLSQNKVDKTDLTQNDFQKLIGEIENKKGIIVIVKYYYISILA